GQSQVLAYQRRLADQFRVHILSYERPEDLSRKKDVAELDASLRDSRISWHRLTYHGRPTPLTKPFDISAGVALGAFLAKRDNLTLVHARSYVPGAIARSLQLLCGTKFIFDIRGFWADERVDGGIWPADGVLYRTAKRIEKSCLQNTDHLVSLTHAGIRSLRDFDAYANRSLPPFSVIPTCADLNVFSPVDRRESTGGLRIAYVGSVGTWYRFDRVAAAFASVLRARPDARFLVLNKSQHEHIHRELATAGIPPSRVEVRAVAHTQMGNALADVDLGVFFYKSSFSRAACSPTKLGEMLGCGIPCLTNGGVGDVESIVNKDRVGVVVDDLEDAAIDRGVEEALALLGPATSKRCRQSAERHFSLDAGVEGYRRIYESLSDANR
ncbi:MAG: glycosyltransferase, partial [Myxococcota bacterium]